MIGYRLERVVLPHLDVPGQSTTTPILAVGDFDGDLRDVITQWKFHRRTALTGHLASLIVATMVERGIVGRVDVVTWAPTSDRRRRRRGYDQAEELARCVARRLRLPCRRLLRRCGDVTQTGRSRRDRIRDCPQFVARPVRRAARVLVVDDVVTTGSTLRSAEGALRAAGHRDVILVALGSTPDPAGATPVGPGRRDVMDRRRDADSPGATT